MPHRASSLRNRTTGYSEPNNINLSGNLTTRTAGQRLGVHRPG
ncbi:hypothetical protein L083_2477 [Actinoplanes sp. N902-109]|nr:hypothetical protein L083_2477 [Actinoplanes sp. N902-109]